MTEATPSTGLDEAAAAARVIALLPCGDVDAMAEFWAALGLRVTYRQLRPNPFIALERGMIALQYYGMPDWVPENSHSTCMIVVPDTQPVHDAWATGLRELYGRLPVSGAPRMTRPRERANNGGLSGFSLIDPAGNWIRVTRAPDDSTQLAQTESGSTTWTSEAESRLGKAMENAVVIADSHGDAEQGRKVLAGALRRASDEPVAGRARALAYLVELCVRCDDPDGARDARRDLAALPIEGLDGDDVATVQGARDEAEAVLAGR